MSVIQKGDQYPLPFSIKQGNQVVTPENSDDVRIKVGGYLKSYSNGELVYNPDSECWEFPLTEVMSRSLHGIVMTQIGVKIGQNFVYSADIPVEFSESIINEPWG